MQTQLLHVDDRLALASLGPVFINVLRQPLTIDGVGHLRRLAKQMWELHDGRYGSIALLEPSAAANVSDEVRAASAAFAREFKILGAAIVIEGSGFRPAATRTLIAGMYLVTKKEYPHKICSTSSDGAAWLRPLLPAGPPVGDIVAAGEFARASIKSS